MQSEIGWEVSLFCINSAALFLSVRESGWEPLTRPLMTCLLQAWTEGHVCLGVARMEILLCHALLPTLLVKRADSRMLHMRAAGYQANLTASECMPAVCIHSLYNKNILPIIALNHFKLGCHAFMFFWGYSSGSPGCQKTPCFFSWHIWIHCGFTVIQHHVVVENESDSWMLLQFMRNTCAFCSLFLI